MSCADGQQTPTGIKGGATAEELPQARMGFLGVELGVLFLLVAVAMFYAFYFEPSLRVINVFVAAAAMVSPFIGFLLAIARRGLWNVDLILKRATVYSVLAVLFFVGWSLLEVTIEGFLFQFTGGPIGRLGAPVLAAGLVAVSQRKVAGGITRRFFSESINFDRAVENVSEDLATAETGTTPGAYLGERLTSALGADPCAVLVRLGENLYRKVWSTGETTPAALLAGAASTALEAQPSAIVMTDDGPVLAARIGKGESYPGLLLLGPRQGGRFYTTEERRLLRPLLNQAALLLKQGN